MCGAHMVALLFAGEKGGFPVMFGLKGDSRLTCLVGWSDEVSH